MAVAPRLELAAAHRSGPVLSCSAFTPLAVNAAGPGSARTSVQLQTPRTVSTNLSFQYALTNTMSANVAYVFTDGSNLQQGIGNNEPSSLCRRIHHSRRQPLVIQCYIPFPDFGEDASYQRTIGSSIYNGLQTKLEQQFSNGLNFLFTYTYSKTMSDAGDLLNGGSIDGLRAPWVPGLGPRFDWGLADFDIRNVFHFSGGYELPFGKNKQYLANVNSFTDKVIGGWSLNGTRRCRAASRSH